MKRTVIVLVFLLAVAGTIFFFGWIQFQIPPGAYAVLFSRTDGWESDPIEAGTFAWRWQRLLPTNMTLYIFEIAEHETRVSATGELPSSSTYAQILPGAGGFAFSVDVGVITRLRPEMLPELARDHDLRPDTMPQFYERLDAAIAQHAVDALTGVMREAADSLAPEETFALISDAMRARIERERADLEIVSVVPRSIRMPDLELYTTARDLTREVLRARTDALIRAAEDLAMATVQTDHDFEMLERYGQILDRFPVLLEYFRVGQQISGDPLNIQSLVPQPR